MALYDTLPGLAPRLPSLPRLGGYGARMGSRRAQEPEYELSPEEQRSVTQRLVGGTLGTVGAAGSLLDLPDSMFRDTLSTLTGRWANPFDQLLSPFSPKNRTTGRDLMEHWGALGPNKKGFDWGDVAGFGADLALSPTMWLTGGAGAATKFGGVARAAGVADDAVKVAAKKLGKAPETIGKRFAQRTTTLDDFLQHGSPEAVSQLKTIAANKGISLSDIADQPMRSALGIRPPLSTKTLGNLGTGAPYESGIGRAVKSGLERMGADVSASTPMDLLGRELMRLTPFKHAAGLFDPTVKGMTGERGRYYGRQAYKQTIKELGKVHEEVYDLGQKLRDMEAIGPDTSIALRAAIETGDMSRLTTPQMMEVKDGIVNLYRQDLLKKVDAGLLAPELRDRISEITLDDITGDWLGYAARYGPGGHGGGLGKALATWNKEDLARYRMFKGFSKGTEGLEGLLRDPDLDGIIKTMEASGATKKEIIDSVTDSIANSPRANEILPDILDDAGNKIGNRYRNLAKYMVHHPEVRENGLFTNHILADLNRRLSVTAGETANATAVTDWIAAAAKPADEVVNGVPVADVLKNAKGFEPAAAQKIIGEKMGANVATDDDILGIANMAVDPDEAAEMVKLMQGYKSPESARWFTKVFDSFTNLFKVSVLTRPARYVRDITSGMARNAEEGVWSLKTTFDAENLLLGRTVNDAHRIPYVEQWLRSKGRPVNAEEGTRALRVIFGAHRGGIHAVHTDINEAVAEAYAKGFADLMEAVPGGAPTSELAALGRTVKTAVGMEPGSTLKLWGKDHGTIRGVFGAKKSTLGPPAAGDLAGAYTDNMVRAQPFINLLRQGWDPAAAMERINWMQVNYAAHSYTPTDRVMKRIFPFWSFMSRQFGYTAKKLFEEPGGRMGASIRAMAGARDPDAVLPEHISETAAIPITGSPLEKIFGSASEGTSRYLTGLGLMWEDPISMIKPLTGDFAGGALEMGGRFNPFPKHLGELATQESWFQSGRYGGRPWNKMDPPIARAMANISDLATGEETGRVLPFGGFGFENLVSSMTPIPRMVRTATDPEKVQSPLSLLANLGTGIRVSDIRPAAQAAMIRDLAGEELVNIGGREMTIPWMPEDIYERLAPSKKREADILKAWIKANQPKKKST